jgi:serine phosphatase RsbU (regulator of sigma subunit)/anti-sigma regulatory factor (Ser/Thr protein kinase)
MLEPGAMRQTDALDLLAKASGILASSFDLAQTLPEVAQLCTRECAEYCAIIASAPVIYEVFAEAAQDDALTGNVANNSEPLPESLRKRGLRSVIAVPIVGRQEILGTFVFASRAVDAFTEDIRKLAAILALQIANALDQTALFERTQRVADRLQRALLPDTFPTAPDVRFCAAYMPASDEAEIGGDWYDAFSLPDGRVAISMGDVAGHGLEAATIMGELRQAMRSVALTDSTPTQVLEHINGIINARGSIGMVTAIFGFYQPKLRVLTYAVAGHPAPALTLNGGRTAFLPGGGIPMGIADSVAAEDWTITLPPDARVTFYTDGMTEYSRNVLDGEEALLHACASPEVMESENPAQALQESLFRNAANRDDAAVLVLAAEGGEVTQEMRFTAIPLIAPIVRASLNHIADECGLSDEQRFAITLAAGEAVANAVEHAYRGEPPGIVSIRARVAPETITLDIEDHGRWRAFERREERGRGITLMHEMMSGVKITSAADRTRVTLTLSRSKTA